jgi:hypothetical protein
MIVFNSTAVRNIKMSYMLIFIPKVLSFSKATPPPSFKLRKNITSDQFLEYRFYISTDVNVC